MFLIFLFFILNIYINNVLFWWTVFLLITLIFLFINKKRFYFRSSVNYFVIQEFLGLLFLISYFFIIQFFILIIKVGVSPFHFWVFSVSNILNSFILMWFLTFQKLPFLPVIILLFVFYFLLFFLLGLIFCYLQIFLLKNFKSIFVVSSTESFNWILILLFLGFINFLVFSLYYFFNMVFLILYLYRSSFRFLSLDVSLIFLNIPFGALFFIKIFSLNVVFIIIDFFILIILFLIFLSSISLAYWLVNYRLSSQNFKYNIKNFYYFIVYYLAIFIFVFHFSKR